MGLLSFLIRGTALLSAGPGSPEGESGQLAVPKSWTSSRTWESPAIRRTADGVRP